MYQVIRTIPASILFQHDEYTEVLSVHKYRFMAWLSYLWNYCMWLPIKIVPVSKEGER